MALLNLARKTLNVDGSTTVFGAQGNAMETIVAGGATTVFAVPAAPTAGPPVQIWYAPAPTGQYFQNILDNPQFFQTIGDIKVFKMYLALDWPDATLKAFFGYCAANGVKLGAEAPALVANSGEVGSGVEGFASTGAMLAAMTRIQALGGTLSYVSWDEPLFYGSTITNRYTVAEVASLVAASASAVRAIFPNVQINDIEPVDAAMGSAATLQAWFTAYAKASGSQFSSFVADTNTESLNWQSNLASTIAMAHQAGIAVGEIIVANGAAPNNQAWAGTAVANAIEMLSDPALRPDFLDVQSWQPYPSETANPAVSGTLASVAADIQAAESAAMAVPAVATYTADGILRSVRWSSGGTAAQNGTNLIFTSPSGATSQFAWGDTRVFAFNPDSASVSLTVGNTAYTVTAAAGAFTFTRGNAPGGALTLALTPASATGSTGSGMTSQATPTLTGTAAPKSTIQLQVDGSSAGTAVASSTGTWKFTIAAPLAVGAHLIEATGGAAPGAASQQASTVVSVHPMQSVSPTLGLAPGSDTGYPGDGITTGTTPAFAGVADPNMQVALSIDGTQAGSVTADGTGHWTDTPSSPLARGAHVVTAAVTGPPGTSSVVTTLQVTIDTAAQEAASASPDPLFDAAWYMLQYPGAASATAAYTQYNTTGWKAGFDPSPFFSTSYYLAQNRDVAGAGINPLLHFETHGWQEGRNPSATFNTATYQAAHLELPAGEDPLVAYINGLTIGVPPAAAPAALPIHAASGGSVTPAPALSAGGTSVLLAGSSQPGFTLSGNGAGGTIVTHS